MKKFILFIAVALCFASAQAQPKVLTWASYSNDSDTLNNTTSETTETATVGKNAGFSATVTLTLISGTSGGKIYWEGSNKNGNFVPVDSATMTQQNFSSNTYKYSAAPFMYHTFRVRIVPTGTQSQRIVGALFKQ